VEVEGGCELAGLRADDGGTSLPSRERSGGFARLHFMRKPDWLTPCTRQKLCPAPGSLAFSDLYRRVLASPANYQDSKSTNRAYGYLAHDRPSFSCTTFHRPLQALRAASPPGIFHSLSAINHLKPKTLGTFILLTRNLSHSKPVVFPYFLLVVRANNKQASCSFMAPRISREIGSILLSTSCFLSPLSC
jgi:hypothetical protein